MFWQEMDEVTQGIPESEEIMIGGDINGHVGMDRWVDYDREHGGHRFGESNKTGESQKAIIDNLFGKRK